MSERKTCVYLVFLSPLKKIPFYDLELSRLMIALEPEDKSEIEILDPCISIKDVYDGIAIIEYLKLVRDVIEGKQKYPRGYLFSKRRGHGELSSYFLEWLGFEITDADREADLLISKGTLGLPYEIAPKSGFIHILCMEDIPSPLKVLDYGIEEKRIDIVKWIIPEIGELSSHEILSIMLKIGIKLQHYFVDKKVDLEIYFRIYELLKLKFKFEPMEEILQIKSKIESLSRRGLGRSLHLRLGQIFYLACLYQELSEEVIQIGVMLRELAEKYKEW